MAFQSQNFSFSKIFLLIFNNFQKNADVSNLKKNFFIIFMTYNIL